MKKKPNQTDNFTPRSDEEILEEMKQNAMKHAKDNELIAVMLKHCLTFDLKEDAVENAMAEYRRLIHKRIRESNKGKEYGRI